MMPNRYKKATELNPKNKEGFYTLGVIAWTRWYRPWAEARAKLGMKPEDPGPIKDKRVREELKTQYLPVITRASTTCKRRWKSIKSTTMHGLCNLLIANAPTLTLARTNTRRTWRPPTTGCRRPCKPRRSRPSASPPAPVSTRIEKTGASC